jgi:phenylalanyl-tRNA synthetase alpha chain
VPDASPADASDSASALTLSEPERAVLTSLREAEDAPVEEEELARRLSLGLDQVRGSLQRLRTKHLVTVEEEFHVSRRPTPRGETALTRGLPERRFLDALDAAGGSLDPEAATAVGLDEEERSAAIGILRRRKYLADGIPFRRSETAPLGADPLPEEVVLRQVADGDADVDEAIVTALERRGLIRTERRSVKRWAASDEGRRIVLEASGEALLGALTPGMLASGGWTGRRFRPYDVRAAVPYRTGVRPNAYAEWLDEFEDILVGFGFQQAEGPLLETEFWNNDVLFMPQDHPARSIHDALSVVGIRGRTPPPELLARVAAVHEGQVMPGDDAPIGPGWGAPYDPAVAARPVLRSQTTAVSARFLAAHPAPPFRMFSLDRNYRREEVDARHGIEFTQCEGILGADGTSIRELVGMFRAFAEAIGIRELKIRPSFFPFTEPSIEGYVRHPRLGWIEIFPGGMFRPEVLRPLGVDVPVAAWGIGIGRLAMISLGRNDLRELYDDDLARLRGGA